MNVCMLVDEEWGENNLLLVPSVAEGSRFVSDSWPLERLQRNAKTDQQQSNRKDRKGLICTKTLFSSFYLRRQLD